MSAKPKFSKKEYFHCQGDLKKNQWEEKLKVFPDTDYNSPSYIPDNTPMNESLEIEKEKEEESSVCDEPISEVLIELSNAVKTNVDDFVVLVKILKNTLIPSGVKFTIAEIFRGNEDLKKYAEECVWDLSEIKYKAVETFTFWHDFKDKESWDNAAEEAYATIKEMKCFPESFENAFEEAKNIIVNELPLWKILFLKEIAKPN